VPLEAIQKELPANGSAVALQHDLIPGRFFKGLPLRFTLPYGFDIAQEEGIEAGERVPGPFDGAKVAGRCLAAADIDRFTDVEDAAVAVFHQIDACGAGCAGGLRLESIDQESRGLPRRGFIHSAMRNFYFALWQLLFLINAWRPFFV